MREGLAVGRSLSAAAIVRLGGEGVNWEGRAPTRRVVSDGVAPVGHLTSSG